jgi:hypothetical protein
MLDRLLKWLLRLIKTLVKIGSNITDNIVSISRAIAYKCQILANLREHIDHKKAFP